MPAKKQGGRISWLIACGSTVIARIGGAATLAGLDVDADGVNQANVAAPFYLVASLLHLLFHFGRKQLFHCDLIWQPLVVETWGIDRRLRIHAEAHPVQNA